VKHRYLPIHWDAFSSEPCRSLPVIHMDLALVWISEGLAFPRNHIMDREGEGEAVAMIATTHSSGGHNTTMHPLG
jgi:hypothetical protein